MVEADRYRVSLDPSDTSERRLFRAEAKYNAFGSIYKNLHKDVVQPLSRMWGQYRYCNKRRRIRTQYIIATSLYLGKMWAGCQRLSLGNR